MISKTGISSANKPKALEMLGEGVPIEDVAEKLSVPLPIVEEWADSLGTTQKCSEVYEKEYNITEEESEILNDNNIKSSVVAAKPLTTAEKYVILQDVLLTTGIRLVSELIQNQHDDEESARVIKSIGAITRLQLAFYGNKDAPSGDKGNREETQLGDFRKLMKP